MKRNFNFRNIFESAITFFFESAITFFSNRKSYSLVRVARSNIAYSYFENEYRNQFERVYDGSCIVVANDNTYIVDSNNVYVKKKTK